MTWSLTLQHSPFSIGVMYVNKNIYSDVKQKHAVDSMHIGLLCPGRQSPD